MKTDYWIFYHTYHPFYMDFLYNIHVAYAIPLNLERMMSTMLKS